MLDRKKTLVIVLSRNYSTGLGVIRSLGAAGYTVDLIASTKRKGSSIIASSSKYVRNSVEVLLPKIQGDTGSGLIEVLMEYVKTHEEKMVLFPADDFTASVVSSNYSALKEHFFMPQIMDGAGDSLSEIMNKTLQGELARKAGLLTPLEWVISLNDEISISENVVYPCFVKPLQSISGQKTEMAVCNNEVELESHLQKMKAYYSERSVLVQEYLYIDKEYDLSGVCLDQQVIIPAVIEKNRIAKHELGVTMSGKIVQTDVLGEVKGKIVELLKQFHYVGMFDMELNCCSDKIYFNEVNFRSGGPNYAYYLSGVNLPALFVKEITGEGHLPTEEKIETYGKTFVYEKVAWEDYIHGYMTKKELDQCIREADFTLLASEEDASPGKSFQKRIRLSALKHQVKALVGREKVRTGSNSEKPQVVIAGRNYCNILTMSRDLGEAGYEVAVLRVFKTRPGRTKILRRMKPDAYSRYVKCFKECIVQEEQERIVNSLIEMADVAQKMLLMPVDDYVAGVVDRNLELLKQYYKIPNVSGKTGEISRLMDKNEQKRLAAKFNLPMLHSTLIKSENGRFEIPEDVYYPCFIKPNVSMNSTKAKMKKCENKEELRQVFTGYAETEDFEMLVEEFAEIQTEYSILGVSTEDGITAPGLFKVIEGGHKERKGVTLIGETVPCSHMQSLIDECNRFIQSLHYTGLFDVDLIETKDGKVYFVELNFRAGASTHVLTETGVNLPGMFADYLLKGKPVDTKCSVKETGKRFVSEKILMEEYARGDANLAKVRRCMKEVDVYFIKDERDPRPYRYFRKYYPVVALMRIPYRVRDVLRKKLSLLN